MAVTVELTQYNQQGTTVDKVNLRQVRASVSTDSQASCSSVAETRILRALDSSHDSDSEAEIVQPRQEAEDGDDSEVEFDPYLFIKNLPPLETVIPERRMQLLPR